MPAGDTYAAVTVVVVKVVAVIVEVASDQDIKFVVEVKTSVSVDTIDGRVVCLI